MVKSCLGLDIGHATIKLVEAQRKGKGVVITRYGSIPTPEKSYLKSKILNVDGIAQSVRTLVKNMGTTTKSVCLGLTSSEIVIKTITMPNMQTKELEQALEFELHDHVGFAYNSPKEVAFSYDVMHKDATQQTILLVACKREVIEPYMSIVDKAGLDLAIIDIQALALPRVSPQIRSSCFIDIGSLQTTIYIQQNDEFKVYRILPLGMEHLINGLSEAYSEQYAQSKALLFKEDISDLMTNGTGTKGTLRAFIGQLVGGVLQTLDFFRAQERASNIDEVLDSVCLVGGVAHVKGIDKLLNEEVDISVEVLNPFTVVGCTPDMVAPLDYATYASATGLAIRGLEQ